MYDDDLRFDPNEITQRLKAMKPTHNNTYYQITYSLQYNKGNISKPYFISVYDRSFMRAINRLIRAHSNHTVEHVIINGIKW